ncbi:hypothetical protein FTUN_6446 [Frigoriglobus tundricola]|uniref:Uncharacterized protein n=1 Tax=Frigoriglobus tundricola TaxID=2774151 RepID=A0A6M5Z088_9BACT|nr:hypothetical protein FTUN_6446 [Frigoriglobus tundricola]
MTQERNRQHPSLTREPAAAFRSSWAGEVRVGRMKALGERGASALRGAQQQAGDSSRAQKQAGVSGFTSRAQNPTGFARFTRGAHAPRSPGWLVILRSESVRESAKPACDAAPQVGELRKQTNCAEGASS